MSEMDWRQVFVNKAVQYLGAREGDSKHQEIIDAYNMLTGKPRGYTMTYKDSWCAAFVSAVACLSEVENIVPLECSCYYMMENAKAMGIWDSRPLMVNTRIGDIVLYDWDADATPEHVGIITNVTSSRYKVIEGNKNDMVDYRIVDAHSKTILGVIKPDFASLMTKSYDYQNLGWNHDDKGWWYAWGHNKGQFHQNNAVRIDSDLFFFDVDGYCVYPERIECTGRGAMQYIYGKRV